MVAAAHTRFADPITTVVDNALPTFSFNGDARPHAAALAWENLHQQFEGIVRGALNTTQAALPGMREQGFGRIVNVGEKLFHATVVTFLDSTDSKRGFLFLNPSL